MERDFMGLKSKDSTIVVKEEILEICKDSEFVRSSEVPWPLSNKCSAFPHFMSFKGDHLASPGLMTMPDASDTNQKRHSSEQKNFAGAILGGIPVAVPHSVLPSNSFLAGTTESRFKAKSTGAPTQMTIFYGGAVSVFDAITPEQAQAIMFLAINGSISHNVSPNKPQAQPPPVKIPAGDAVLGNQIMKTPPTSSISSPISVSSHPIGPMDCDPTNNDEVKAPKTASYSTNLVKESETSNAKASLRAVATTTLLPSAAVPQFRKASLARFLEKRKQRAMNSAPYNLSKKSAGESNANGFTPSSAR